MTGRDSIDARCFAPALERALQAAEGELGFELNENRRGALLRRLNRLVRRRPALARSIAALLPERRVPDDVMTELIREVTIGETRLFRQSELIDVLRAIARRRFPGGTRVLSAGCSTGEEAWSMAAVLADLYLPGFREFSVVGWDVDAARLAVAADARACRAPADRIEPALARFFHPGRERWAVRDVLRPFVSFERVNLARPSPITGRFHLIVVCNTAIYWSRETARVAFSALLSALEPDGRFFLGPADVMPAEIERDARVCRSLLHLDQLPRSRETRRPRKAAPRVGAPVRAPERTMPEPSPASGRRPLQTALELANAGAYDLALAALAEAPSTDVEARFLRAQVLLNVGDGEAARAELRACSFLRPEDARFRRWLALCVKPRDALTATTPGTKLQRPPFRNAPPVGYPNEE